MRDNSIKKGTQNHKVNIHYRFARIWS